ncbi:MAG: DNA mismatch repair protein MutS [Bacteroidales bacterium]|nr:DNA mismatch repair protein MutS [Bacteroidales bacterium]
MKIKELIKQDAGFLYIIDNMEFMSSAGRRKMLNEEFCTDACLLQAEWQRLDLAIQATKEYKYKKPYIELRHCLMQLHDLQGTLTNLANHTTLNEVELFEIKNLAQLTHTATDAILGLGLAEVLPLPDTTEAFHLLDPDHTGIANFYIYDSYDARLTPLRRELKALQEHDSDPIRISQLLAEQNDIQQEVCTRLSDQLTAHHNTLATAMEQMAYADFLLAKADLAIRWELSRPEIGESIVYKDLVNPRLQERNEKAHLRYQPVDIALYQGVCLITGANMAGKTVLLKSVGTAQLMAQCGMYVPASKATIRLVEGVVSSIGDEQDEMNGLSSYASEIIKISHIIDTCRSHEMLVLIDEPARTTNPVEGKALVQAIIKILNPMRSITLITTHYGQLGAQCRKLRVKGFVEDMSDVPLTPQSINRFIDYSLTEDQSDNVPHEALRIATILGCDGELIALAQNNINSK